MKAEQVLVAPGVHISPGIVVLYHGKFADHDLDKMRKDECSELMAVPGHLHLTTFGVAGVLNFDIYLPGWLLRDRNLNEDLLVEALLEGFLDIVQTNVTVTKFEFTQNSLRHTVEMLNTHNTSEQG